MSSFEEKVLTDLRELRALIETPPRGDDLVDAAYIAARTGLKERTVREGKAGTNAIPRVELKKEGASRPLIRYQRAAVDKWIRDLSTRAVANQPRRRALSLVNRKQSHG